MADEHLLDVLRIGERLDEIDRVTHRTVEGWLLLRDLMHAPSCRKSSWNPASQPLPTLATLQGTRFVNGNLDHENTRVAMMLDCHTGDISACEAATFAWPTSLRARTSRAVLRLERPSPAAVS